MPEVTVPDVADSHRREAVAVTAPATAGDPGRAKHIGPEFRGRRPTHRRHWELRATSSLVTGVEEAFIESYRDGSFQYVLIAADRV